MESVGDAQTGACGSSDGGQCRTDHSHSLWKNRQRQVRGGKEEPLKIPSIESLRAELAREESRCNRRRVLWNMAAALVIAAAMAGLILTRVFALIEVDGNSMEPTLANGEILFLRRTEEVRTGDTPEACHRHAGRRDRDRRRR